MINYTADPPVNPLMHLRSIESNTNISGDPIQVARRESDRRPVNPAVAHVGGNPQVLDLELQTHQKKHRNRHICIRLNNVLSHLAPTR